MSRTVTVTFIHHDSGDEMGVAELDAAQLPETFALQTKMHLGEEDWTVEAADPRTREECARTGKLTLRLRRVMQLPADDILFSLPSICDAIPAPGKRPVSGGDLLLAEDDWRQFELVSSSLAADMEHELAAVRRIHEEERVGSGWRTLHVRRTPVLPIAPGIPLADVLEALGVAPSAVEGVAFEGMPTRIAGGGSFTAPDGQRFYVLVGPAQAVVVLGIAQPTRAGSLSGSLPALESLCRRHQLELVHWCLCARAQPGTPLFAKLLQANSA